MDFIRCLHPGWNPLVHPAAVSLFGQGALTFHIQALFRTPPGWDLMITGPPNRPREGIMPLSGVVEADWSPYTFTMNWKFTRRNHWVRFKQGEPVCFIHPVLRGALEQMNPIVVDLEDNPALHHEFEACSRPHDQFQAEVGRATKPSEWWQKRCYGGVSMSDERPAPDRRSLLRVEPFAAGVPGASAESAGKAPALALGKAGLAALVAAARRGASTVELAALLGEAGVPNALRGPAPPTLQLPSAGRGNTWELPTLIAGTRLREGWRLRPSLGGLLQGRRGTRTAIFDPPRREACAAALVHEGFGQLITRLLPHGWRDGWKAGRTYGQ